MQSFTPTSQLSRPLSHSKSFRGRPRRGRIPHSLPSFGPPSNAAGHLKPGGGIPFPSFPPQHIMPPSVHTVQTFVAPRLTEEELAMKPRAHPHLVGSMLYINNVPSDLSEEIIARALKECMPVRIKLDLAVPPNTRIQPDEYYAWMPKSGTLTFDDMYNVEKAMAILSSHPLITFRSIFVSPYPYPTHLPFGQSRARHIRPTRQVYPFPQLFTDATDHFIALCPSPGELFEAVRSWGTVRDLRVWAEAPLQEGGPPSWGARIEFWYDDEARRFEIGFGQRGSTIKGWQVIIMVEPAQQMPFPAVPSSPPFAAAGASAPMSVLPTNSKTLSSKPSSKFLGPEYQGIMTDPTFIPWPMAGVQQPLPMTPPATAIDYVPPWASHNPYTIRGTDLPLPQPITGPFPLSPEPTGQDASAVPRTPGIAQSTRHRTHSNKTSMNSLRHSRNRTWSVTLDKNPAGEMVPVGLVADDGTFLLHGPGQHIRPAPESGPGSTSSSGLVDYSNVFVKHLDPDINTEFLAEYFSRCGTIISARVMRDFDYRSRGYGFVSFSTPAEAARAIEELNGTKLGKQQIFVTLHEPRKIRQEKVAQLVPSTSAVAYGRHGGRHHRSPSIRQGSEGVLSDPKPPATLDVVRSYTPVSRKEHLDRRIRPVVETYVRVHKVPAFYLEPTIKALANEDLALIPLLHDHEGLVAKIAETMSDLQIEFDVAKAASKAAVPPPASSSAEITPEEVSIDGKDPSPLPEGVPVAPSQAITPVFEPLDLSTATLSSLAELTSRDILENIEGDQSTALLSKFGIGKPTAREQSAIAEWTKEMMAKPLLSRKSEMVSMLQKKLDMTFKRQQKVKAAKDLVNQEEDHEALCLLMAYPKLINARAKCLIGKTST